MERYRIHRINCILLIFKYNLLTWKVNLKVVKN